MKNQGGLYVTITTILGLTFSLTTPAALAEPADYYPADYSVGAGIRAGFNDDVAAVMNAKVKITDLGTISLSGRPAVFFSDEVEFRLAITGEGDVASRWSPFFGGGIAINAEGTEKVDPLLTTGLDFQVAEDIGLQVGGNLIFKSNDTDVEMTATVNYTF